MTAADALASLILYRNDPEIIPVLAQAAELGDADAQYGLGLVLAEGRGVAPDPVLSYYWLSRAEAQGDADARTLLRMVAAGMSREQVDRALNLLRSPLTPGVGPDHPKH